MNEFTTIKISKDLRDELLIIKIKNKFKTLEQAIEYLVKKEEEK